MFVDSGRCRAAFAVAATIAATSVIAGCGTSGQDSESPSSTPSPTPFTMPSTESWPFPAPSGPTSASAPRDLPPGVSVDRASADSVALAAARVWFGWDTTRDRSPYDAALRTAPLMGSACQEQIVASAPQGGAGEDWTRLARVHAKATVDAGLGSEERPPDKGDRATRIVGVTQEFRADKPVQPRHLAVMVVLTRTAGAWAVGSPSTGTCGLVQR